MNDLISRQAVLGYIDRVLTIGTGKKKSLDFVRKYIETLPSAELETHEKRTETHACDLIDRQAAIDTLRGMALPLHKDPLCEDIWERDRTLDNAIDVIRGLPSAQTEVTEEALKDYCRKRCLTILTNDYFHKLTSAQQEHATCYLDSPCEYQNINIALSPAQQTLRGYNIEHLELIARVLQKENLPPERIVEALTDIGRIVAIVIDEFEETLRK